MRRAAVLRIVCNCVFRSLSQRFKMIPWLAKALFAVGEDWDMDALLPIVMEVGEKNLKCMALLDKANTESYGTPAPVTVPLTVEKGPFIVITGHDLHDLKLLLEQTEGKGVNIYTHGEMLPAHGYPELKKYAHLKGNFGTAWQNQQREFADIPAPVLFTTNCLMPPKASYADRVFILPDALRNRPEVTLLIKARSTQCIASNTATVDQGDTGTITSDMAANKRSPMRFGTIAVKSNK